MARNTTCTTVKDIWWGKFGLTRGNLFFGVLGGVLILAALVTSVIYAVGMLNPWLIIAAASSLLAGCSMAMVTLSKARAYFFDHRLICLGGDKCAIAQVKTLEDNADGDKSMNVLLAPAKTANSRDDTMESEYKNMYQPALLVYADPTLTTSLVAAGFSHDPKEAAGEIGFYNLPSFHCEIEGTYFDDLTKAIIAYLATLIAFAMAALVLASILTALGALAGALFLAIAILAMLLAILGFSLKDPAGHPPSFEATPIGQATPNSQGPIQIDQGGNSIKLEDFVALFGRHVCDTGHFSDGGVWNELHPVMGVTKIESSEYLPPKDEPTSLDDIRNKYCEALKLFVINHGVVKQGHTAIGTTGRPLLTCLEHEAIG